MPSDNAASPSCLPLTVPTSSPAAEQRRLEGIIRSAMEAIITIDESQRIILFNPMAEKLLGCSAAEAIGSSIERFIPARFRPGHADRVRQFGVTGVTERKLVRQQPLYGQRIDGSEFPIEASISQFVDGHTRLYTVMLRDITDRLKAEADLKASRNELRRLSANIQTAREAEKTRIARELHDDLGQRLTALKMDVSLLESELTEHRAGGNWREQTLQMQRLIDDTVSAVRGIAADLRPVMLDDLGLLPAIEWLANEWRTRHGIVVRLQAGDSDWPFDPAASTAIFRIVQEALTNVVRHANATRASVVLERDATHCTLRIADNGVGYVDDPESLGSASFGLIGMRERAHLLGGELRLENGADGGFVVTARLPLSLSGSAAPGMRPGPATNDEGATQ